VIIVSPEHYKVAFKKSVSKFIDAPVMVIGSENMPAIPLNSVLEETMIPQRKGEGED
jgi:hypothetical protein